MHMDLGNLFILCIGKGKPRTVWKHPTQKKSLDHLSTNQVGYLSSLSKYLNGWGRRGSSREPGVSKDWRNVLG